ncbi:cadherin-15 [Latimeria chalumnae]|uniref:Cadherin 15 n=1 Tax=Latimeria chalumnae TaxID=7897 RepID=H3AG45_LATCH|nr:PREDICTED: cadherin-15 isoform X1 [Latimeria chalumnae]|eukprot:XP_006003885.1 PREDICTED: cadherin-15 isoform X1 [Latimeria chalumnae]
MKDCVAVLLLTALLMQVSSLPEEGPPLLDKSPELYPWRREQQQHAAEGDGVKRVKRAWVIPPISVSENHKKIPLLLVQIRSDKQELGKILYSIKGPGVDEDPVGVFSINRTTGHVFLNTMLDREKNSKFNIMAYAVDLGGKTLEEPSPLQIIVVDQNDNRPVFDFPYFIGHVQENSPPGSFVTKVAASDADDPETDNAALKYRILDHGSNVPMFSINEDTGEIRTVAVGLDRELVSVYNLTLSVTDMVGRGLSNTATTVIHVDDINDNAPEFTSAVFTMELTEGTAHMDVGRVSINDKDQLNSTNWRVRYTITDGDPEGVFAIRTDPETNEGILSVEKVLDHEVTDWLNLTISVANEAELSPSAPKPSLPTATIIVQVKDLNEPPSFAENPKIIYVSEGTRVRELITHFHAADPDVKQSQNLRYSIEYDPADWLTVDPNSGDIFANQDLNKKSPFLKNGWYTAVIIATDNAVPPGTATGTLSISIKEENDFAPVMYPLTGVMCSEPGKGTGIIIGAMDADLYPHAEPFHFQFSPNFPDYTQNWTITPINDTHAAVEVHRETKLGLYPLPILVSDSGNPSLGQQNFLNVSTCKCDDNGDCKAMLGALTGAGAGLSHGALVVILASVLLLLLAILLVAIIEHHRHRALRKGLLAGSEDDVRDNILNYDEQGGGEEDQDGYNMDQLRNPNEVFLPHYPHGKPPIRMDAPYNYAPPQYPRKPPSNPNDIEDFINDGLDAADNDPNVPPYDTALIYDYEGEGSVAGTLSSIASGSSDGEHDYDYLNDWGPRFKRLADMYGKQ